MRLLDVRATPHPDGGRIVVSWRLPDKPKFERVRVVRREATYPTKPNPEKPADGFVVPEGKRRDSVIDTGLRGETVYYYSLYPFKEVGPGNTIVVSDRGEQVDPENRASAMATSAVGIADEMYRLLPSIYKRYDGDAGALRGFLELPGGQLDQLYSLTTAALGFHDPARVDGSMLPLLAEWIGWNTDRSLELARQRNEIRHAPELYRAVGLVAAVVATVGRIAGRRSRVREFVHNVAATNRPERLNLWQLIRHGADWQPAELVSLDGAFGGRPAVAIVDQRPPRMFYEHEQGGGFDIRSKELAADGWKASAAVAGGRLSHKEPAAAPVGTSTRLFWSTYDDTARHWRIESRTLPAQGPPSDEPFVPPGSDPAADRRKPFAVSDGNGVWLFWQERDDSRWVVKYNRHDGTRWQINPSPAVAGPDGSPLLGLDDVFAVFHPADASRRLWLFFARQDPSPANQDPALPRQTRWSVAFRVKAGINPAVNNDWGDIRAMPKPANDDEHDREPCALVMDDGNLEVFWSSHRGGRWSIWRRGLNHTTQAWSDPEQLPVVAGSMRAPVALRHGADTVVVVRSSESVRRPSKVFSGITTLDARYAGTTTFDTRNKGLVSMRGKFEDFASYVYDTGRSNDDWYARDTVGVYLPKETPEPQITRSSHVLTEFMPVTDRAVFVKEP